MIKQINLKIVGANVIAYMNEEELFKISSNDKTINIDELYKKMNISKNDSIENLIEDNNSPDKGSLDILYDNTKIFLDELIKKINEAITQFDFEKEEKMLIKQ